MALPDYAITSRTYYYLNGFRPDLRNPRDLSEKVLWLKLNDHSPLHTFCADKIRVRDHVAAEGLGDLLVPALYVTRDPDRIGPGAISAGRFVIKTNHDQGGVFICRDREAFDWEATRAALRARMKLNKYRDYQEWQYRDIPPALLVEQFVEGDGEAQVPDIKVNCFGGQPRFVQVILDRFGRRRQSFYDPDWRRLEMRGRADPGEDVPRPARLDDILAAAERLARPFLFLRVDFLLGAGGRPWFGEMTFHPSAGLARYRPAEVERELGDMIDLTRFRAFRRIQREVWRRDRSLAPSPVPAPPAAPSSRFAAASPDLRPDLRPDPRPDLRPEDACRGATLTKRGMDSPLPFQTYYCIVQRCLRDVCRLVEVYRNLIRPTSAARPKGLAQTVRERVKRYIFPDYVLARRQYYHRNGFYPDLSNPRDLSEKILWLKLYDRSPLHTTCADKIRARDYVAARIGSDFLVPKIMSTYDISEVNPETIREPRFVIKTNHDQGGIFICLDRSRFDWRAVQAELRARTRINKYYEYQERQYRDIRPGVLVESFVEGDPGRNVVELKVNCFQGKPHFVQAIVDRFEKRRHVNYDTDWRRLDLHGRSPGLEYDLPRPACLERVLEAAAALAAPFLFSRIDFLVGAGERPWFGEITFHPAAGLVRYNPPEMERALGDLLDLRRFAEFAAAQRRIWSEQARSAPALSGALSDVK